MAESVHLLLSAGRGPRECGWAVAQLLRRLEADAGRHGLMTHRVETVAGDRLQERDLSGGRAVVTDRWHIHDDLVRGDPIRIERPPMS